MQNDYRQACGLRAMEFQLQIRHHFGYDGLFLPEHDSGRKSSVRKLALQESGVVVLMVLCLRKVYIVSASLHLATEATLRGCCSVKFYTNRCS